MKFLSMLVALVLTVLAMMPELEAFKGVLVTGMLLCCAYSVYLDAPE